MSTDVEFMLTKIVEKLKGGVIIDAIADNDREAFGFIVKVGDKEYPVWVDQDAEANGPGWLDIAE